MATPSTPDKLDKPERLEKQSIILIDKEESKEGHDPAILQDYLLKKGGGFKSSYQERYFILFRDVLWWKPSKDDPNILGIIPLETLHFVAYQESKNEGKAFDFIVRSADASHTFQLSAKTKEIAGNWVRELNKGRSRHEYRAIKTRASGGKFWKSFDEVLPRVPPKSRDILEKKLAATGRKSTAVHSRDQNLKKITAEVSVLLAQPEEGSDSSSEDEQDKKDDVVSLKTRRPQSEKEEEQREIQRQLLLPSSRRMICQGLMSKKTKEHHKRVQFSQWHHRFFVLYDDRLEYYKNKGGELKGSYPLSQIDGVQIPSEGTGFRFELMVKTSRHDKGRTVSLLTQSNTKLHEWVRAIKETLYVFHLKTGGEEGERKAKAMGVAPEALWAEWNYSFETTQATTKTSMTPEEKAREIAAEERAAAELRRLGGTSSPTAESSSSSDTSRERSTSDPTPALTLTLDPTIPFGTTSGSRSTPAPTASSPSISPTSSPASSPATPPAISPTTSPTTSSTGSRVYFPETTSRTKSPTRASQPPQLRTVGEDVRSGSKAPPRASQPPPVRTIGEDVRSFDTAHRMLPSLRASLMQRKAWSSSKSAGTSSESRTSTTS